MPTASSSLTRVAQAGSPLQSSCVDPYSALLQVGFTLPPASPRERCAFTAPFQTYRRQHHPDAMSVPRWSAPAVYFLWHFPSSRPESSLRTTIALWSPDFPPVSLQVKPAATQPPPTNGAVKACFIDFVDPGCWVVQYTPNNADRWLCWELEGARAPQECPNCRRQVRGSLALAPVPEGSPRGSPQRRI